eukprot:scaffold1171_cov212-Alexandrium_tamarense.AAC.4
MNSTNTKQLGERRLNFKSARSHNYLASALGIVLLVVVQVTFSSPSLKASWNPSTTNTFARNSVARQFQFSSRDEAFCLHWSSADALNRTLQPFDMWWVHHPLWIVVNESDTKFCVEKINHHEADDETQRQIRDFLMFYANQFYSTCQKGGLIQATDTLKLPIIFNQPWNYAANKNVWTNGTCNEKDLTCYFLPYQPCGTLSEIRNNTDIELVETLPDGESLQLVDIANERGRNAYLFATRKQWWLRRAMYDFKQQFKSSLEPESDCTVVHVRRSDVVLDQSTRKYFAVEDYVRLIPKERLDDPNNTVFLLTDDANAIEEAHEFFPHIKWKHVNRTRSRGSEGAWEGHTPSGNPALEVIMLLSIFDLASECSAIVYGHSNFADYIIAGRKGWEKYRVDEGKAVFDRSHNTSEVELKKRLDELRREKGIGNVQP